MSMKDRIPQDGIETKTMLKNVKEVSQAENKITHLVYNNLYRCHYIVIEKTECFQGELNSFDTVIKTARPR